MPRRKPETLALAVSLAGTLIGLISATDIFMAVEEQGWIEG